MDGIIIFADDDVLTPNSFENKLYKKLRSKTKSPVLPIRELATLEATVKSMSNFRVLILDWNFRRNINHEEMEGSKIPPENPMDFLRKTRIYSFIYIYSETELHDWEKDELKELFPNKIDFRTKDSNNDAEEDVKEIIKNVEDFEDKNKHMKVPFKWSQAINQSVQKIFIELEQASPQWIREIYNTAKKNDSDPDSEVISTFGHLLNDALIQDNDLRKSLRENFGASGDDSTEQDVATMEENTAKLYRRIFYSKVAKETPITTGDIFKFDDGKYGILITPECNLSKKQNKKSEKQNENPSCVLLPIDKEESIKFKVRKAKEITKSKTEKEKNNVLDNTFNNGVISRHVLPSFPFEENEYDNLALIDFCAVLRVCDKYALDKDNRKYRLNAPYIHQLRQRFVSYLGRYGTPDIPESLGCFYLNHFVEQTSNQNTR